MSTDREYRIRIQTVADNTGAQESANGIDKLSEKTGEAGKQAEHAGLSHHALHMMLSQVGQTSKAAEIGMAALAGVMMGSATFGVMALAQGMRLLIDHFQQLKEKSLEVAKATVDFWKDTLEANTDARKAAEDYTQALAKIIQNVDALKQKEAEEEAVLKKVVEGRLKILDAERQAEIAKAGGDKEEEARINFRYGRHKLDIELQNEAAEIDLKKKHSAEQTAEAMSKQASADAAAAAKVAGAPGREEARLAAERLPKLNEELPKLQAARMDPAALEALTQEVARRSGEAGYAAGPTGPMITAAGSARQRIEQATEAEAAYYAAQQEYEQAQADIERFKTGTQKLADAVDQATAALGKAVEAMRATNAEISKAEADHKVNVDATTTIQGVNDRAEIEMAGGKYNQTSQNVLHEVRAMAGTDEGLRMSGQDTAYFNNLLAAARASHKEDLAKAVIAELRNMHVDEAKKWQDLTDAIRQIRREQGRYLHTLPGN